MKTDVEQKTKTKIKALVEIPAQVVNEKMEEIYRSAVKDINMPGFRRGKIPRRLLEARFGKDMFYDDTQSELMQEYLPKALEELEVEPVSEPDTEVIVFDRGKPFKFRLEVEILPEIELINYSGVEIEDSGPPEATEKQLEEETENMRRENAVLVPKEGKEISSGDVVILEDLSSGEEFELKVSEENEISSRLIGKKKDEEIDLPDYNTKVKVLDLKEVQLPKIDELAQELGYDNLENLKKEVKKRLTETNKETHQEELSLKILDKIASQSELTIPSGMVNRIIDDNLKSFQRMRNDSSLTLEDLLKQRDITEEKYKEEIIKEIKRNLVLKEIKEKESIHIDDQELEKLIEKEAKKREINQLKFKNILKASEGGLGSFREHKENEKVLKFIRENAKVITEN